MMVLSGGWSLLVLGLGVYMVLRTRHRAAGLVVFALAMLMLFGHPAVPRVHW